MDRRCWKTIGNCFRKYSRFKVMGFLDDNIQLHKQVLLGQKIYSHLI